MRIFVRALQLTRGVLVYRARVCNVSIVIIVVVVVIIVVVVVVVVVVVIIVVIITKF